MTMTARCLPRSPQMRLTISSGDSVKAPGVFAVSTRLVRPPASPFSRSLKAWKLVTTILAAPSSDGLRRFHFWGCDWGVGIKSLVCPPLQVRDQVAKLPWRHHLVQILRHDRCRQRCTLLDVLALDDVLLPLGVH